MKKLRVSVDGKVFDVTVEILDEPAVAAAPRPAPVASVAPSAPAPVAAPAPAAPKPVAKAATASGPGAVVSPLSGKLVSIDVKVGQPVEEGTQVATVEAMKMNTYVYAPKAGKVAAVSATPGEAVEEGAVLLTIE